MTENIQIVIEQACIGLSDPFSRKQAEAILLEFRQSENPVQACRYILEHSESLPARFQAALTLREAALRAWAITPAQERQQLRSYILHFIVRNGSASGDVITSQLSATVASMLKRGWMDISNEEQHAFYTEVENVVTSEGSCRARRAGIRLLEAVVMEFCPATASPLGLPWDYHERCRASLEAEWLQPFFTHAISIVQKSIPAAVEGRDEGVCQACMSLLSAILSWEFRRAGSPIPVYGDGRPSNNSLLVKPDCSWRDILLSEEAVSWLIPLLEGLRRQPESHLAAASRQLLVLYCSISGDIFPKEVEQERAHLGLQHALSLKDAHLQRMLGALMPCIAPPEAVLHNAAANNEAELLDACKALAMLAQVHRVSGFARARVSERAGDGAVLQAIADLTRACISAGGMSEEAEGTWTAEATDLLLDTWVELLYERAVCSTRSSVGPPLEAEAAAAATVFQSLTEGALRDAVECAHLDEAEGEAADDAGMGAMAGREEWFARAAAIGRACAAFSAGLLCTRMQQKQQHLQHCAAAGQDPSEPLEELHWLTRMAAHLLADSGEGETPLVPMSVAAAAAAAQPGSDTIEALSHALLGVAGLCLDERVRLVASPRLMEAAASGVARWADTYLMPSKAASAGLVSAFGLQGGGPAVLQALVQVANISLSQYTGEVDLHRVVAARLLPVLTQQAAICRCLAHLDAWRALVQAFAEQAEPIRMLAGPTVRALAKALTVAAGGLPDQAAARQYITHLLTTITDEVASIAGRTDLAALAERPDVMARVVYLLEALRGSMRGTCSKAQPALFSVASAIMTPVVSLQKAYHNQPAVSCQLLKLAADVVEAHISFVEVSDARILSEWVLHLLQLYSTYNLGQVSVAAAARLRAEAAADSYREVRALIRLLSHLTNRDVVDFGRDQSGSDAQVDIAKIVFLGLDLVIPLVTGELLQFPKLVRSFFSLLSYMMEIYPEHVASLPDLQMRTMLSTLEFGVNATDVEIVQGSLEALAAIAKCHHSAVALGAAGIASPQGGSLLGGFLELLVRRLLLEDLGKDTMELAADALFPLILSHTAAFQSLGEKLLASQQDTAAQSALIRAMNELLTANGLEDKLDRGNRRRFRENLTRFIVVARSIVRLR